MISNSSTKEILKLKPQPSLRIKVFSDSVLLYTVFGRNGGYGESQFGGRVNDYNYYYFVVIGRVPNPHKYIQAYKSVWVEGGGGWLSPQDL